MTPASRGTGAGLVDFLYVNRARLSLLAAQLFEDGVVSSVRRTDARAGEAAGEASLNFAVLKANLAGKKATADSVETEFDARWNLALNVLLALEGSGHVRETPKEATPGSLVVLRGRAAVLDLRLLKSNWKTILDLAKTTGQGPRVPRRALEEFSRLLGSMPHELQLVLRGAGFDVWAAVDEEWLQCSAAELTLKYAGSLVGEWVLVGYLDGTPEELDGPRPEGLSAFHEGLHTLLEVVRSNFGRPPGTYAVTPLLLFREVSG